MKRNLIVGLLLMSLVTITFGMRGAKEVESPSKYPYQVSIRVWPENYNICAGTILGAQHILTAASCVYGWFEKDLRLFIGSNKLDSGKEYEIASYRVHESYDATSHANDIAIVKTKQRIARRIGLASEVSLATASPAKNTNAIIIGWGNKEDDPANYKNKLQELGTKVEDRNDCDPEGFKVTVSDKQICTSNAEGEGFCRGDYGGPMIVKGKQVGIMSHYKTTIYEPECGNGQPLVYTSVPAYASWIMKNKNF